MSGQQIRYGLSSRERSELRFRHADRLGRRAPDFAARTDCRQRGVDVVVRGEGELVVAELAKIWLPESRSTTYRA